MEILIYRRFRCASPLSKKTIRGILLVVGFQSILQTSKSPMSDLKTIFSVLDFTRDRLTGSLDGIAKSGQEIHTVLAWRPGPGRAHIAWQAMHCAATHDKYVNVRMKGGEPLDPSFCESYSGGSTPSDSNIPTLVAIREKLAINFDAFKAFLSSADLTRVTDFPNNIQRTIAESAILLAWHEAHHQGQIHLTWNLYKAAHSGCAA